MEKEKNEAEAVPTAHIAINRNRVKHYGNLVYLKNGTNFELELFNPKKKKVLAKIWINGEPISSGGVALRPGERVFLQRWLDEAKKFVFESYVIDDSPEATLAILENGKVKVCFYEAAGPMRSSFFPTYIYYGDPNSNLTFVTGGSTVSNYSYYSKSTGFIEGENEWSFSMNAENPQIETGTAEKGEIAKQSFESDFSMYDVLYSQIVELQILPESMKPVETAEIRTYCSKCGTRTRSSSWKFCPTCGSSL